MLWIFLISFLIVFATDVYIFTPLMKPEPNIFNSHIISPFPVSVLIPIYNKANYLNRSFGSLAKQTYHHFEIIAIDDCSSDLSSEYVLNRMRNDYRIKLIQHTYNQGISSVRNHGVIQSKGTYILSLDPDDSFYSNAIEVSLSKAKKKKADVLEFRIAAKHRGYTNYNWVNCYKSYKDNEGLLTKLQKFRLGSPSWSLVKKIIRREVYMKAIELIKPFVANKRIVLSEDMLQFNAIMIFSRNFICTNDLLYMYYKDLPHQATGKGYSSRYQMAISDKYLKSCVRYIYKYRKEPEKSNFDEFLNVSRNFDLYRRLKSIDRTPKKSCFFNIPNIYVDVFNESGYCLLKLMTKK